jgi:hypothetical protein
MLVFDGKALRTCAKKRFVKQFYAELDEKGIAKNHTAI